MCHSATVRPTHEVVVGRAVLVSWNPPAATQSKTFHGFCASCSFHKRHGDGVLWLGGTPSWRFGGWPVVGHGRSGTTLTGHWPLLAGHCSGAGGRTPGRSDPGRSTAHNLGGCGGAPAQHSQRRPGATEGCGRPWRGSQA